jgi:hypothetical protein
MPQKFTFEVSVSDDGRPTVTLTKHQGETAERVMELREYALGCKTSDDWEFSVQKSAAGVMFVTGRNEVPSQTLMQRLGAGRKK